MAEKQAKNDAFVAYLSNPKANVDDYLKNGITADNTLFLEKDEYKRTPLVQKLFSKDGVFDEGTFDKIYEQATKKYLDLNDEKAFQNYLTWGSDSNYAPLEGERRSNAITPYTGNNPEKTSHSIIGLNAEGEAKYTRKELALMGKIWDSDEKKWLEGTAESRNLIESALGKTLVYALYDKDGILTNPITGKEEFHRLGDWMTDENGDYFTMTISDTDLRNRLVVSFEDILTKEDSWLNNLDFFDSDGKDKSIAGIAMKTLTKSIPYFIPTFGSYYGAAIAAGTMAKNIPTILKAMDSFILRDTEDSEIYKSLTAAENWFKKFTPSLSENAELSFASIEGIGTLIADTVGLLSLQLAAGSLAKYFYKIPEVKGADTWKAAMPIIQKLNKTALRLALGYMAIELAAGTYNDALKAGYDNKAAGLTALASAGALYHIMNFNESTRGLGTWFLNKTTGYDKDFTMSPLYKIARKNLKASLQILLDANKNNSEVATKYLIDYWRDAKDWFHLALLERNEGIFKNAIIEGVEEVSEEAIQDTVKGIVDAASYFGLFDLAGSFGGFSNVFSKEGASRYLLTLLGGAFGGAMFDVQRRHIQPWFIRKFQDANYKSPLELDDVTRDLIDIALEDRMKDYIKALNSLRSTFNSKKGYTEYTNEDGVQETLLAPGLRTLLDGMVDELIKRAEVIDTWVKENVGVDTLSQYDEYTKQLAIQTWGQSLKGHHVEDYLEARFRELVKKTFNSYDNWRANKELLDKKAEGTEDTDKTSIQQYKKLFEKDKEDLLNFFSGKQGLNNLAEVNLLVRKNTILPYLIGLDEETFYNTMFKNNTFTLNYKDLPSGKSDMSTVITKEYVDAEYEKYRKALALTTTTDQLVDVIPRLTQLQIKLNKLVSADIAKFVNMQNKETLMKIINNYTPIELYDNYVESLAIEQIFSPEELAALERKTDEEKDRLIKERRALKKEQFKLEHEDSKLEYRAGAIAKIIDSNKTAFDGAIRVNFDLAKELINAGVIDLKDFNNAQLKIITDFINQTAVDSGLSVFNKQSILELLKTLNAKLNDPNNAFAHAIREASDKTLDTESIVTSDIVLPIFNLDKLNEKDEISGETYGKSISNVKFEALKKLIGDDKVITKELKNLLYLTIANLILDAYADNISTLDNGTLALDKIKSDRGTLISGILGALENPENPYAGILNNLLYLVFDGKEITINNKTAKAIQDLISSYLDIEGKEEIINPLVSAINKLGVVLKGAPKNENTIAKYLSYRDSVIRDAKELGEDAALSEDAIDTIKNIINALTVLDACISSTIKYSEDTHKLKGLNEILLEYIRLYGGNNKEDLELFPTISMQDGATVRQYITEVIVKLQRYLDINKDIVKSKSLKYEEFRIKRCKALIDLATKTDVLRKFTIALPGQDDKDGDIIEVDLLEGLKEDALSTNDIDATAGYVNYLLSVNLNALYKKYSEKVKDLQKDSDLNSLDERFVKSIVNAVKNILYSEEDGKIPLSHFLTDGLGWDSFLITESGKISKIKGQYLAKKLVQLAYFQPKDLLNFLHKLYSEENNVSPREDLVEALINLEFSYRFNNIANYIQNSFKEAIDAYKKAQKAESSNLAEITSPSTPMQSIRLLYGAGGSGKTSLLAWFIKLHKNDKDFNLIVSAIEELKVRDLETKFELEKDKSETLLLIFPNYAEAEKKFKDSIKAVLAHVTNAKSEPAKLEKYDEDGVKVEFNQNGDFNTITVDVDKTLSYTLNTTITASSGKNIISINNITINKIDETITNNTIPNNSVIILDEVTLLSPLMWKLLEQITENKNVKVIGACDPVQAGYSYLDENGDKINYDLTLYNFDIVGNLLGSWRSDNTAMNEANSSFYSVLTAPYGGKYNISIVDPKFNLVIDSNVKEAIKDNLENRVRFTYTLQNNSSNFRFLGTLVTSNLNELAKTIEVIDSIPDVTKCIIINDTDKDKKSAILEDIKKSFPNIKTDSWTVLTVSEVQGQEFDYSIIYKLNTKKLGFLSLIKNAFTAATRAKKGLLIITDSESDSKDLFTYLRLNNSSLSGTIREYGTEARDSIAIKYFDIIKTLANNTPAITVETKPSVQNNIENDDTESVSDKDGNEEITYDDNLHVGAEEDNGESYENGKSVLTFTEKEKLEIGEEPSGDGTSTEVKTEESTQNTSPVKRTKLKKETKLTKAWENAGITNGIGLGTWYTRLGICKNTYKALKENTGSFTANLVIKKLNDLKKLVGNTTYKVDIDTDFYSYILLVIDNPSKTNITDGREPRTIQEWFNSFEEFKFLLIKSDEEKYTCKYNAITRHAKQDPLMWAFHKINDDPKKSVSNTWEAVIENNGKLYRITLGALFHTDVSKLGTFYFERKKDSDHEKFKEALDTYYTNRAVTDDKKRELLKAEENHPGVARYTDMIMMKLDPAEENSPNARIGIDTYGRMKLSDLEDLGFKIEEDFKKPGLTKYSQQDIEKEVIAFYDKYRFAPMKDTEEAKKLSFLGNKYHIICRKPGLDMEFPLRVFAVGDIEASKMLTNGVKNKYVRPYFFQLALSAFIFKYDIKTKVPTTLKYKDKFKENGVDLSEAPEINDIKIESLMKLCEYFFDEDSYKKLNLFVNVVSAWAKQHEDDNGKFVEELLYDYVLHIFRHTGYLTKNINNESLYHKLSNLNEPYLKANQKLVEAIRKINNEAGEIQKQLSDLVNKVNGIFGKTSESVNDSTKTYPFFYLPINATGASKTNPNLVIEHVAEPPRYVICLDCFEPLKTSNGIGNITVGEVLNGNKAEGLKDGKNNGEADTGTGSEPSGEPEVLNGGKTNGKLGGEPEGLAGGEPKGLNNGGSNTLNIGEDGVPKDIFLDMIKYYIGLDSRSSKVITDHADAIIGQLGLKNNEISKDTFRDFILSRADFIEALGEDFKVNDLKVEFKGDIEAYDPSRNGLTAQLLQLYPNDTVIQDTYGCF